MMSITMSKPSMRNYVNMLHSDAVCTVFGCGVCVSAEADFHADASLRPIFHEDRGLHFVRIHGAHVVRTS